MTYVMRFGDDNIVRNIRFKYGDRVKDFSDVCIVEAWHVFSQSEDYGNDDKYLEWLETIALDIREDASEVTSDLTAAVEPMRITRANVDELLDARRIQTHMASGAWWDIRRNGQTKTWKSQPGRIRIPYKYGFRGYGAITTWDFVDPNGKRMADNARTRDYVDLTVGYLDPEQYRVKP